jgi:hypothetical protein
MRIDQEEEKLSRVLSRDSTNFNATGFSDIDKDFLSPLPVNNANVTLKINNTVGPYMDYLKGEYF